VSASASVHGSNGFVYSESLFAAQLGLPREHVLLLRSQVLREGVDWVKKGREIALNRPALKKVWREVKAAPATLDLSRCVIEQTAKKEAGGPLALPERVCYARPATLRVKRIFPNREYLQATDEAGNDHHVLVYDNTLFMVGMTLPACPSVTKPGTWQLVGKLPRMRGRWT